MNRRSFVGRLGGASLAWLLGGLLVSRQVAASHPLFEQREWGAGLVPELTDEMKVDRDLYRDEVVQHVNGTLKPKPVNVLVLHCPREKALAQMALRAFN